jgi:CNT family concentrative nucleoside transporter
MAPDRKKDLAKIVTKAMIGGALASWLTATVAGILI